MPRIVLLLTALLLLNAPDTKAAVLSSPEKKAGSVKLEIGDFEYVLSQKEVSGWVNIQTTLQSDSDYHSEIENGNICQYFNSLACRISFPETLSSRIRKVSNHILDEEAVKKFIDDLARKSDRDPENAKFKMEDGRVSAFSLSKKGLALKKDMAFQELKDFLLEKNFELLKDSSLKLTYAEKVPEITIDSVESMGIKDLISQGKSSFRGSPKNRIHNITVATSRFNGLMIKPGEEFSFVKNLGEVDGDHGYLPELVIKNDKTEPEFGGGICQVSTTAFRAAINAGLEITARRNHAYPVSYYNPQGMDASVYIPRPDLRFKNNTPGYILIQTEIQGTDLTFNFYGTDDGRKTEIIGPKIIERKPDGSMKTTFTQKVIRKDGSVIREDVFNSNYDSPDKYPHPGETPGILTTKPSDWSDNEWKKYKKEHGL